MVDCVYKVDYSSITKVLSESMEAMVGEVLSIFEAALPDGTQLEASKRLVKQAMWRYNNRLVEQIRQKAMEEMKYNGKNN